MNGNGVLMIVVILIVAGVALAWYGVSRHRARRASRKSPGNPRSMS